MIEQPGFETTLAALGDIAVYQSKIVTPSGTFPMRGSHWTITDQSIKTDRMPTYAVVLAVVFIWLCLLSLLFLLIKERVTTGYVEITVQSSAGWHRTQVPVSSDEDVMNLRRWVDYCRYLSTL